MKTVTVRLSKQELLLLVEALDSHIYWQLSEESERNSGHVIFPDKDTEEYREGSADDRERWEQMAEVERLEGKLSVMADQAEE